MKLYYIVSKNINKINLNVNLKLAITYKRTISFWNTFQIIS